MWVHHGFELRTAFFRFASVRLLLPFAALAGHPVLAAAQGGPGAWSGAVTLRGSIAPDREHAADAREFGVDCGSAAARFQSPRGQDVWVVRTGSTMVQDALRPLAPERLIVLAVVANGRLATAIGQQPDRLQAAGPAHKLETERGFTISWDGTVAPGSQSFSTVAEDGSPLLGPLTFQECGAAAEVTAALPGPAIPATLQPAPTRSATPRPKLPQGAIPEPRGGAPRLGGR